MGLAASLVAFAFYSTRRAFAAVDLEKEATRKAGESALLLEASRTSAHEATTALADVTAERDRLNAALDEALLQSTNTPIPKEAAGASALIRSTLESGGAGAKPVDTPSSRAPTDPVAPGPPAGDIVREWEDTPATAPGRKPRRS